MKHIAKEMALDFSHSTMAPQVGEHIPGLTNQVADFLSRCFDPQRKMLPFPAALTNAVEVTAPSSRCISRVIRAGWEDV